MWVQAVQEGLISIFTVAVQLHPMLHNHPKLVDLVQILFDLCHSTVVCHEIGIRAPSMHILIILYSQIVLHGSKMKTQTSMSSGTPPVCSNQTLCPKAEMLHFCHSLSNCSARMPGECSNRNWLNQLPVCSNQPLCLKCRDSFSKAKTSPPCIVV